MLKIEEIEDVERLIADEITKAQQAVESRKQAQAVWRGGSDESWKAVGCKLSKKQRLEQSEVEARIGVKSEKRLETLKLIPSLLAMSRALIAEIEHHEAEAVKSRNSCAAANQVGRIVTAGRHEEDYNYHRARLAALKTEVQNEK